MVEKNFISAKGISRFAALFLGLCLSISGQPLPFSGLLEGPADSRSAGTITAQAATDYAAEAAERMLLPIQSNETENWPEGPAIGAEAAIVMEAHTGTILYAKNIHEQLYPASTTKLLTCLIAAQSCPLDDTVTFSHSAVDAVPADGSSIGIDVGESLSLEESLYGIMVGSANEVANAVAEHVSGDVPSFVKKMNETAKALGCTDSHFANTNGLHEDDHYTSAYDLALIANAFFSNELLSRIGNTPRYHFEPTATQPDDFYLNNKHKLITGEVPCEGVIGGKTGYTGLARETLVTACERGSMKLICVVLKEESPAQFDDTVSLLEYGFRNFEVVSPADGDSRFIPEDPSFIRAGMGNLGGSGSILQIQPKSRVILPVNVSFEDTDTRITYGKDEHDPKAIARIDYSYHSVPIGHALLESTPDTDHYVFQESSSAAGKTDTADDAASDASDTTDTVTDSAPTVTDLPPGPAGPKTVYINVRTLIISIAVGAGSLILMLCIGNFLMSNSRKGTRNDRRRFARRRREARKYRSGSKFDGFNL